MRRRVRPRLCPAVVLTVLTVLSCSFLAAADAALTDVEVTPTDGVSGTTVTVRGWACLPGLLINPSHAAVLIVTLGVSIDIPVPPDGAWSVDFVVPPGALQGPHAIVATCTRDLVPLPYAPLTFTVNAPEPPAPSTTIDAGVSTPTTTMTASTTTIIGPTTTAPPAATTGDDVASGGGGMSEPTVARSPATTAPDHPTTTLDSVVGTTLGASAAATEQPVSAARAQRDARRRPLVFGALSPIGHGWVGLLVSALVVAAFVSAVLAIVWFRWLRHTRAREWWLRWHNQILRIRAHARPPA
jgi:hypothetical protein